MSATVSTRLRLPSDQATSSNCGGGATGELSIDSFLREGVRGGEGSRTFWSSCITVSVGVLRHLAARPTCEKDGSAFCAGRYSPGWKGGELRMWWFCVERSISACLFRRLSIRGRTTALSVDSIGRVLWAVGEEFMPTDMVEEEEEEEEITGVLGGCEVKVKGGGASVGVGAGGGGGAGE
jgi:hypothetical protein